MSEELLAKLRAQNVEIRAQPKPEGSFWRQILMMWFPMLLIVGLWVFFIRQMQAGGGKAMSFGKSRARLLTENQHQVTFEDVAGVEESKFELEEIIAFLREPKKFTRLGGRIPKGVLLVGPPGTGKTLLARAVAGEAGVPFYSISGSDFVEMFVGVGASRVRDLFLQGKKNAPCIIFIDEIDAVGRHRGAGLGGGHDEREQTLNQLLVEMDGFESNEGVILIAATNRPDVLDPALLRPGRFDRRVVVPRPDLRGRLAILKVHTRRVALADDVDLEVLARGTPGFVGADLQNLVNEAALLAARRDADKVAMLDFEEAKDKVLLGAARKSLIMSDEDRRATAYHEAGHALVAMLTPGADPVHKVTIIPRGMALGVTMTMPEEDRYTLTRDQILARIKHAMGGRAAEELVFGHFSTGAANDLKQATESARRMVCSYGMSDRDRPDVARRQRPRRVPRARLRHAQGLQREEDAGDRRRDLPHPAHALRRGEAAARREPRRARSHRDVAARARDARGRGAQAPDRGTHAAAAALAGRESGRKSPPERAKAEFPEVDPPRQASRPGARSRLGVVPVQTTAIFPAHCVTIVGILNATPDSFSDGGRFVRGDAQLDLSAALDAAAALVRAGAQVLDVGGESTRPGSQPVSPEIEIARTAPLIEALAKRLDVPISIDTRKAEVARAALDAGARIVNDVSGLRHDPALAGVAARAGATLILGHLRGEPATMQESPHFDDVLREVGDELAASVAAARAAGVSAERLVVDPGLGFGKRLEDNLDAARRARRAAPSGSACRCWSVPRARRFLGALTGDPVAERDRATQAACAIAAFVGADAVRVHDVAGAVRAVAVGRALREARREAHA